MSLRRRKKLRMARRMRKNPDRVFPVIGKAALKGAAFLLT
jgi:hypothetical protein